MLEVNIITLFPEIFEPFFMSSILKKAQVKNACVLKTINLRDFGLGLAKQVDDRPFGGGAGMVLRADVLFDALLSIESNILDKKKRKSKIILTCPHGKMFTKTFAKRLSLQEKIIIICGHYEGVDQRIKEFVDYIVSIGNYILTGGEIPAMIITDAVVRLLPNVLGNPDSLKQGSYAQYTRPYDFKGLKVPDVLLSGNHALIKEWRNKGVKK